MPRTQGPSMALITLVNTEICCSRSSKSLAKGLSSGISIFSAVRVPSLNPHHQIELYARCYFSVQLSMIHGPVLALDHGHHRGVGPIACLRSCSHGPKTRPAVAVKARLKRPGGDRQLLWRSPRPCRV
jgi:hypothetical protein